jgi:hypothetical protein
MLARISHFKVTEKAVLCGSFSLREFGEGIAHVAKRFLPFARMQSTRHINWPQSFARKGLKYSAYAFWTQVNSSRFLFRKRPGIEGAFFTPDVITFNQDSTQDGAIQGDVLTYACDELVLPVELLDDLELELSTEDLDRLGAALCHDRCDWLQEVADHASSQEQAALRLVVAKWTEGRSFVKVTADSSIG